MSATQPSTFRRNEVIAYLRALQSRIITHFESLETSGNKFFTKSWPYLKGTGGGEMTLLRGEVFEKAAVNWSGVSGDKFPGDANGRPFFATGVSLITHMANPMAPTAHFNIRYLETENADGSPKQWWGGGFDLTPMGFEFAADTEHFHAVAERALAPFGKDLYHQYAQAAREYFYIKHYQRERGVGGIFFDHLNSGDFARDFAMWKSVGDHFLDALLPIYARRIAMPFTPADRETQLRKRAHYVEFNLLYDRGTRFGFESGGNPEAILCSMPPLAAW